MSAPTVKQKEKAYTDALLASLEDAEARTEFLEAQNTAFKDDLLDLQDAVRLLIKFATANETAVFDGSWQQ